MKTNQYKKIQNYGLFIAFVVFMLPACAPSFVLQVQRPAEVNLMKYKKIAVSEFTNPSPAQPVQQNFLNSLVKPTSTHFERAGTELADLISTKIFEGKKYELVDRQNIDKILKEQKLVAQGLADEKNGVELGMISTASAIIFGTITSAVYTEDPIITKIFTTSDKKKVNLFTRAGTFSYRANLKFVDATTGSIIALKQIDLTQRISTEAQDATPQAIDPEVLYRIKTNRAADQFMNMIAPFKVSKVVSFETDKLMPELKSYVVMFETNNIEMGLKGLEELASRNYETSKLKAKAMYNYALVLTYTSDPEKALSVLQEVNRMMPGNYKYLQALHQAQEEIQVKTKLKEQGL